MEIFGDVNIALVIAAILGLTEMLKSLLNSEGKKIYLYSIGMGIALFLLYELKVVLPAFAPWFDAVIYGTLAGLTASGLYKLPKSIAKSLGIGA